MGKHKKAFFGGYRKDSVDAEFEELNKKLENSEKDNKRLKASADSSFAKIQELEKTISELEKKAKDSEDRADFLENNAHSYDEKTQGLERKAKDSEEKAEHFERKAEDLQKRADHFAAEIEALKKENEELKLRNHDILNSKAQAPVAPAPSTHAFIDIEKIYRRAYSAGGEIVSDSKNATDGLLTDIDTSLDVTLADAAAIIENYELLQTEIGKSYVQLNENLLSVVKGADDMVAKAKGFTEMFDRIKFSINDLRIKTAERVSAFETEASEFIATAPSEESVNNEAMNRAEGVVSQPETEETSADVSFAAAVSSETETFAEHETYDAPKIQILSKHDNSETEKETVSPAVANASLQDDSYKSLEDSGFEDKEEDNFTPQAAVAPIPVAVDLQEEKTEENKETPVSEDTPMADENEDESISSAAEPKEEPESETRKDEFEGFSRVTGSLLGQTRDIKPPVNRKPNDRFTQFGRKSHISASDRAELLRRARNKSGLD